MNRRVCIYIYILCTSFFSKHPLLSIFLVVDTPFSRLERTFKSRSRYLASLKGKYSWRTTGRYFKYVLSNKSEDKSFLEEVMKGEDKLLQSKSPFRRFRMLWWHELSGRKPNLLKADQSCKKACSPFRLRTQLIGVFPSFHIETCKQFLLRDWK